MGQVKKKKTACFGREVREVIENLVEKKKEEKEEK